MLDQLVESKSNSAENRRKGQFLLGIGALAVFTLLTMWTVSLFGKDFGMGGDDLALTTLVAPVPVPDEEPPPEPEKKPEQQKEPDVDVRKELIQNIMQSPVKPPDVISVARNPVKEMRLDRMTKLGVSDSDTGAKVESSRATVVDTGGTGGLSDGKGTAPTGGTGDDEPPPPPPKPKPTPPPPPKTVSGGVLNGKATSLPKPAYPAAAKAVRAGGAVSAYRYLLARAEASYRQARSADIRCSELPPRARPAELDLARHFFPARP